MLYTPKIAIYRQWFVIAVHSNVGLFGNLIFRITNPIFDHSQNKMIKMRFVWFCQIRTQKFEFKRSMTGNGNFEINERFIVRVISVKPQDRHCSDFKDSIVEINIPLLGTGGNIRVCDIASNLYP